MPWTSAYIDTIGEPTADLRSNIAAEARAKIVYERLINVTDDPGIKETLGFLMTREVAHQKSFEKALHSIQPNFPQGKLPGVPEFTSTCVPCQGEDRESHRVDPGIRPGGPSLMIHNPPSMVAMGSQRSGYRPKT